MAYQWDFNEDFIGQYKQWQESENGFCTMNMYTGNGLFICLYETGKTYQVGMIALDEEHLKNCIKSDLYNQKDEFILNSNVHLSEVKKIARILTGHSKVTIMPQNYPVKKYYAKVKED